MASSFSTSPPPPPVSLNVVGSDTFGTVPASPIVVSLPSPRRSSPLLNLSPSILIIVTVLAVTVTVSLALCFLLRHLNRCCLRRLSADPSAATTPIFGSGRRVSPEVPSSVIDSLPLFTFSAVAAANWTVCLSKFHNNDLLRLLPLCCHAFHAECIDTWLRSNLSCPLCRSAIFAVDSDLAKVLQSPSSDSFLLEIGNVSNDEVGRTRREKTKACATERGVRVVLLRGRLISGVRCVTMKVVTAAENGKSHGGRHPPPPS